MKLKNKFCCFILLISLIGCKQNFKVEIYKKQFHADKILVVSSTQCQCINEELERLFKLDSSIFDNYLFVGDKKYIKGYAFGKKVTHIRQAVIDSIDIENSDLIIINTTKYFKQYIKVSSQDVAKIKSYL